MWQSSTNSEASKPSSEHRYQDVITIFNNTFSCQYNTQLVKGDDEPIYLPANNTTPYHQIIFAHGYFASALHEIAHWCVAGNERRQLEDFGYWYEPDGRTAEQQALFEQVEVKPQALEWLFCVAAQKAFRVSADNLNGESTDNSGFKQAVYQQVASYLENGIPERALSFVSALANFYQAPTPLTLSQFNVETI